MKKLLIMGTKEKTSKFFSFFMNQGFICIQTPSEIEAFTYIEKETIDLVLLVDTLTNIHSCEKVRKQSIVPIIMVLDCEDKSDIVKALRSGADVCLTNPVDEEELMARVEAVLRRSGNLTQRIIHLNELIWNEESFDLKFYNHHISLAPKEFLILGLFLNHPNKVITPRELITEVWRRKASVNSRTVHSYIRNIRDKLREVGFPIDSHLVTVWGVGYRWDTLDSHKKEKMGGKGGVL